MKGARLLGESEPAANLMNDLIDGYRDGGCYGREAGGGGGLVVAIKKNKKHIVQSSRFIGGDALNEKKRLY